MCSRKYWSWSTQRSSGWSGSLCRAEPSDVWKMETAPVWLPAHTKTRVDQISGVILWLTAWPWLHPSVCKCVCASEEVREGERDLAGVLLSGLWQTLHLSLVSVADRAARPDNRDPRGSTLPLQGGPGVMMRAVLKVAWHCCTCENQRISVFCFSFSDAQLWCFDSHSSPSRKLR